MEIIKQLKRNLIKLRIRYKMIIFATLRLKDLFLKSIKRIIPTLGLKWSHVGTKSVPSRGLFASLKERLLDI